MANRYLQEAISGPVRGLFIAAQALALNKDADQYQGACKVYPWKPTSYSDPGHIAQEVSKARFPSPDVALHHARLKGMAAAERLAARVDAN